MITALKSSPDLRAEIAIDAGQFFALRRQAVLDGCKWDPQVGDTETLSSFPLVMKRSVWRQISLHAERLAAEVMAAEEEILARPDLLKFLGLPVTMREVLASRLPATPAAGRVMRFDFHPTTDGWRISEVNSDVPGGFSEASYFTTMMAEHFPCLQSSGNPADNWAKALADKTGPGGAVALLSTPGYMEDHQVIAYLAAQLRALGCCPHLAKPEQILWRDGQAHLNCAWHRGPLDAIVKFYQAEWMSRLPEKCGWKYFYRGGKTPVANPARAVHFRK
jgi:hypothetical protein